MKYLFTIDSLRGGGTETSLLELIKHFSKDSHATVCYFYDKHDLKEDYEKVDCELIYFELPGRYSFFSGIRKLKKLVQEKKFDLIVSSLYRSSVMSRMVSFITGVPLIDTMVNESYGLEKAKEFKGFHIVKLRLVYFLDRMTSFIPKMWISNSAYLSKNLGWQLGISESKIAVIYRGRQADTIPAWMAPEKPAEFHFVSIGRLFHQKGHDDLIRTFSLIQGKHPHVRLTIYGEGPERKKLEQLISDLHLENAAFLPGRDESAWKNLYAAHCFVLPSRYEGFSGALVEAMMSGIPIIASDIPVNKEAVTDGKTGLLYRANNTDDLLSKMTDVLTNFKEAVERGKEARKEALVKYDIKKIAAEYEEVLRCYVLRKHKMNNENSPAYTKATTQRS